MYGTYDHTGDGVPDLVSQGYGTLIEDAHGLVYAAPVPRGSLSNADAYAEVRNDSDGSAFAYLPTPLQDTDGDGVADLLVQGGVMSGPVPSGVSSSLDADRYILGIVEHEQYTFPVDLGDIDGNGLGDFALNARSLVAASDPYIVGLSGASPSLDDSVYRAGAELSSFPPNRPFDMDSDGIADLVLAPFNPDDSVRVWYGPVGGMLDALDADVAVSAPSHADGMYPSSLGHAGDHDGDGYGDLFIGWSNEFQRLEASEAWLLLGGPR